MCTSKVSSLLDAQNGLHFTPWQMRGWQWHREIWKKGRRRQREIQFRRKQLNFFVVRNEPGSRIIKLLSWFCNWATVHALKRNYLGRKLLFQKHKASTDIEIMNCMTYDIITCHAAASANGVAS